MEKKTIEIDWEGVKREIEIKKLNFGEVNEIQKQSVQTRVIGNAIHRTLDEKISREMTLLKGILNAPFEVTLENIRELSATTGIFILGEIESFNNLSEKKKRLRERAEGKEQRPAAEEGNGVFHNA